MSDKNKRANRRAKTKSAIKRQLEIVKAVSPEYAKVMAETPHKLAKKHALSCGNPKCVMCGNPRKFYNEETMQEKRFIECCKIEDNLNEHSDE